MTSFTSRFLELIVFLSGNKMNANNLSIKNITSTGTLLIFRCKF